eukprot:TRINITY_DN5396_c0_g1_i1.p1 TRINITY_DN5396_c0_g1~~TRINITY_DN5396_c0_g1_i1.p1  ORF type:complete len:471 (+),score=92.59 TRINITY_DN5396_c0_g1_i1:139-1551(+)
MSLLDDAINPETKTTFESLGVCEPLCKACDALGFKQPTRIQAESIPFGLSDRDIIGLAETGSGKTAAFCIPVLQSLWKFWKENPGTKVGVFACALAPTRELAFQIAQQFESIGSFLNVRCGVVVGGVDKMEQARMLGKMPHIIVATPGRLMDHLQNTKGFSLRSLKFLIMDEADRLLSADFERAIYEIVSVLPKKRRTFLFSATMTEKVKKLQTMSLSNPARVAVSTKYRTVETLIQNYLFVPDKHRNCYLVFLLNEFAGNSVIIFTEKRDTTLRIAMLLRALGFPAVPLHGQMTQEKRLASLNKFKAKERSILIATDVASRGLDIPSVDIVVNYDISSNPKDYVHRVGRTARAGKSGRAISFVTQYNIIDFKRVEKAIHQTLDVYPTDEEQVLVFLERVTEAQRQSKMQLKEIDAKRKKRTNGSRGERGGSGGGGGGEDGENKSMELVKAMQRNKKNQQSHKKRRKKNN